MKKPNHLNFNFEHGQAAYEAACAKYEAYLAAKKIENKAYRARKNAKLVEIASKAQSLEAALTAKARQSNRIIPATREEWFMHAVELLRAPFSERGFTIPAKTRVSMGFMSQGVRSKSIGECWHSTASSEGFREIFISPLLSDRIQILDVLVHELGHACLPDRTGHKAPFKKFCKALNLEGKVTATHAGPELKAMLEAIYRELGELPHATMNPADQFPKKEKQPTRMIKCECYNCKIIIRTTQKSLDQIIKNAIEAGRPAIMRCTDPNCGTEWELDVVEGGEEE